ncbi:putative GPI anchored protein [Aspergillus saccharolyticus JOP 1030-1]|uniref:Uncharacterized protein n=1 Tax=Aspergillus saccharolyticus JOP 1030-1 TaxID=1450539 RepID=A0A319AA23_9EURO|nr:hypothetical protein BP01DRAFT_389108 [Aspergillus saccharolyticus JOP 1030-1]PYH48488.1 hypothetical protein BP01DRAFT_389108 [Aspergillus saccharolyticus JOP 1030-1]
MRIAQLLALSGLRLASTVTFSRDLDHNDVLPVGIAAVHLDWDRADTLIPLCEACIGESRTQHHDHDHHDDDKDNDNDHDNDPHDNDAYDILRTSCSLSTTTWNPAAATSTSTTGRSAATATGAGGVSTADTAGTSGGTNCERCDWCDWFGCIWYKLALSDRSPNNW